MKKILLINAIVWATLIIAGSLMLKDHPNYNYFFIAMVFCAGLMNSIIYGYRKKINKSC